MTPELERAFLSLIARHEPASLDWNLTFPAVSVSGDTLTCAGALPTTLHFGRTTLSLESGLLSWIDEDHRDGGDLEVHRAWVSEPELAALRALR